jgi:hypothetical protein
MTPLPEAIRRAPRLCSRTPENGKIAKMGCYPASPDYHYPEFCNKAALPWR